MASVRHATSVQGADDPGKSVQAAQWNEDHTLVNVADQTSLDAVSGAVSTLSLAVSVVAATLSNETSARIAGDNAASGAVSTLSLAVSVVAAALSNEISLRAAQINTASGAVSTLSLAVSVVAAQLSTTSIQVTNVSAAVSVVAVNLSNEISLRASQINTASGAVSTLSLALSVETAARIAADNTASGAVSTLSLAVSVVAAQLSTTSLQVSAVSAAVSVVAAGLSTLSIQVSTLSAQMTSLVASKIVMLGAQTISVSALTNVSGQAFSIGANNTYAFKYMVIYQAASTNTGLGLSVTFPGMKTFAATALINSGATGTANLFCGAITASGTKIQALSCQTANTDFYAVVEGTFQVSTSGTLQLQADSGVGGTSAQVIIRPGTFGMVWRGA
jgi:hypothetical protein